MNFLKDKKFIKTKKYGDLEYYYINPKLKLKRDKFIDFTKMKEISSEQLNKLYNFKTIELQNSVELSSEVNSLEEMTQSLKSKLVFERKDYISSLIMKICKQNKELSLDKNDLFSQCYKHLKTRFELEESDFQKTLEYLIDTQYIEQVDTTKYKYII